MKIALDTHVSDKIAENLSYSYDIVYHAYDEHDEIWFKDAYDLGAEVFISMDYDIQIMSENRGLKFIRIPQNKKGIKLFNYIDNKLLKIKMELYMKDLNENS